jgi:hypothetical protein
MKYQLVLQWPARSIQDYDALVEIENALIAHLSGGSKVDGHDFGSGEMNIFVMTDRPQTAFDEVKAILGSRELWPDVRAAYREITGDDYTILWPKDLTEFKVSVTAASPRERRI